MGKKSQSRNHLPVAKPVSAVELHVKRRDRLLPSSQMLSGSFPSSSSTNSLSKTQHHNQGSDSSVKTKPGMKTRVRQKEEEACFTLTLTPEAVLLLQQRSSERHQRLVARNAGGGAGVSSSITDSNCRRENLSKKHQPAMQSKRPSSTVTTKNNNNAEPGDISSIVKISLLNEQYKYDDVEYEEEEDYGVDECVLLKCTEWLRGLENTLVAVGNNMNKSASSMKSF
ncbi:hypothetical protein LDENG_00213560 [Lucifuga dentata]|nr:hypothetical protein LDENG_00213560 [Lucifuga dentata]